MSAARRLAAGVALILLIAPEPAAAHGLAGPAQLPLPRDLFLVGAASVVLLSFGALAVLWRQPILQEFDTRAVLPRWNRVVSSQPFEVACALMGVGLFAVCVWSAFWGVWPTNHNFAQTFIFVIFWVGLVPVSVLFGDVYRLFNPWRAIGRFAGWLSRKLSRSEPLDAIAYPTWLGYWPAAIGLLAFGWLELVHHYDATTLGIAIVIYSVVQFAGMGLYGTEQWSRRGDAFAVYFHLFSRIGPWTSKEGKLALRPPLTGLTTWPVYSGAVALLSVVIGTVTFDGLSQGGTWQSMLGPLERFWSGVTLGQPLEPEFATGLIGCVVLVGGFYALGTFGAHSVGGGFSAAELRATFLHTLAPIALAYAGAHYFSLLMYFAQGIVPAASDPLGRGWDLFGTASTQIDFGVITTNQIWWTQLTLVLVGHVLALSLAHDRALAIYKSPRTATRSQYWMLAVMIGYTTLALWLLHGADTAL